jgi:hypothetical protein
MDGPVIHPIFLLVPPYVVYPSASVVVAPMVDVLCSCFSLPARLTCNSLCPLFVGSTFYYIIQREENNRPAPTPLLGLVASIFPFRIFLGIQPQP